MTIETLPVENRPTSSRMPWVLRLEATFCFFWPLLGLATGLLYWDWFEGLPGGHEKALYTGIIACGVLGIYGLMALSSAAMHAARQVKHPVWLMISLCLGAAACGGAVRRWDFGLITNVILPMLAIGHFLWLTRHQFTHATTSPAPHAAARALGRWATVGVAAAAGSMLAGPQAGLQADYTIAPVVTRTAIEADYGDLLNAIEALPDPRTASADQQSKLVARIAADPALIHVRFEVMPLGQSNATWFAHANREIGGSACFMRSQDNLRDGLIRCRMTSGTQLVDMLHYSRYGRDGRQSATALKKLEVYLDYQRLLVKYGTRNRGS